jgi:hypothetical protein
LYIPEDVNLSLEHVGRYNLLCDLILLRTLVDIYIYTITSTVDDVNDIRTGLQCLGTVSVALSLPLSLQVFCWLVTTLNTLYHKMPSSLSSEHGVLFHTVKCCR